ncbi:MAG: zinc ribbon domain-containing protein [Clostridium sp.]|nr:zinc ribbon domain-containing protein [Clostridium sp.]MCM1444615.1 zinc ribbon domain-containing protein [Candidatus Amulumruptor caecigallinarius]
MFCKNCGKELKEGETFCTNCGMKVSDNEVETNEVKESQEEIKAVVSDNEDISTETNNETFVEDVVEEKKEKSEESSDANNSDIETNNENSIEKVVESSEKLETKEEISNTPESNHEEIITKKKKNKSNKGLKIALIIAGILVIAVVGFFLVTKFILFTPKNLFNKGIEKLYSGIENSANIKESEKYKDKIVNIKANSKFDLYVNDDYLESNIQPILNILNDIKISTDQTIDTKTSEFNLISTLSNDAGKLSIGIISNENGIYYKLNDLYDKYLYLDTKDITNGLTNVNTFNQEDFNYAKDKIKEIFMSTLDDSKFEESDANLKLNDNDENVKAISYKIDEREQKRIYKEVISKIKDDSKLMEILTKMSGLSKEELIDNMNESNISDDFGDAVITLKIYTKGLFNDIVGYSLTFKEDDESIEILYTTYNKIDELKIKSNGMTLFKSVTEKESKEESTTTITLLTLTGTIKEVTKDKETTLTANLNEATTGLKFNFEIKSGTEDKGDMNINASLKIKDDLVFEAKISGDFETSILDKMEDVNTSNYVNIEDLSEEDGIALLESIQNNKFINSIAETLMLY